MSAVVRHSQTAGGISTESSSAPRLGDPGGPWLSTSAAPRCSRARWTLSGAPRPATGARPFEVRFDVEEALDYGGVRREWFELVCEALFERRGGLFAPLADSGGGQSGVSAPAVRRPPTGARQDETFRVRRTCGGQVPAGVGAGVRGAAAGPGQLHTLLPGAADRSPCLV